MTRSLLDFPIEIEILVSDDRPYFSHYPYKVLGARVTSFRIYKGKCGEFMQKRGIPRFLVIQHVFCLYLLNAKSPGPKILQG